MKAVRKKRAANFESAQIEVSLMAVYLGLHIQAMHRHHGELEDALIRSSGGRDRMNLVRQALSGMPQAVVPFHRRIPDIHLAACLIDEVGRACFRSAETAVDAGYFVRADNELRYVDTAGESGAGVPEVLDPLRTRALINELNRWTQKPHLEIVDSEQHDFMRLHVGTTAFAGLQTEPSARRPGAAMQARMSLITVSCGQIPEKRAEPEAPKVQSEFLGTVTLAPDQGSLLMQGVDSRIYMQTHAAWSVADRWSNTIYLHLELSGAQFLSPLPDPLQFGAKARGWLVPLREIGSALGGSTRACTHLPRGVAIDLMRHTPWMWLEDPAEWALGAWWLQPTPPENLACD